MVEPQDVKYRRMIAEKLDQAVIVEAGAGSGKTKSLVTRMLALIASGRSTVDTMAAVTFTRKAAAELQGRFQIDLEEAVRKEENEETIRRYRLARERMGFLFTGTIHSFCARLLRERPIEARLDPDFKELEEEENTLLRDQCWAEYIERLNDEGSSILQELAEIGLDPGELLGTYSNVCLYPEVEVRCKKTDKPDFKKEKVLLGKYLDEASRALPQTVPEKGWDGLQSALRQALRRRRNLDMGVDRDFIKVLAGLGGNPGITQKKWPSPDIAKEQKSKFEEFKEEVVGPCLKLWQEYCHFYVMKLVVPATEYFNEVRKRESMMNFNDLLLRAASLLRENAEVRQYFQKRFTHLLVDEFQDTDPIQAEVILYLTATDLKEKSWRRIKVKPGSLFIVGDPKQSIYRFRRADIDTYNEVRSIIGESRGLSIPLTANFRSLPAVCEWINPVFKTRLPVKSSEYQAAFEPLEAYHQTQGGGLRRITIGKVPWHRPQQVAKLDAERIASWIDWGISGNFKIARSEEESREGKKEVPGPGDFMILLRYKARLSYYAEALEALGIPFEISGGGAFKDSEEIIHLLNLLSAIARPEDQVSLMAALRGPFYGVSDDMLYQFKRGGGTFNFLAKQEGCSNKKARERIEAIFAELFEFYRWSRVKPPSAALSLILNQTGIIPFSMTKEMGESRTGNLLKTLELALFETSKGTSSFSEMVDRLRGYHSESEVEGMSVEPGKADAVRIMNLHKAKGLEAPIVFLADPVGDPDHAPQTHINRMEEKATGFFVAHRQKGEYQRETVGLPPEWDRYEELEQRYQEAEEDRLLYVATTRAKQLLVVSTYPEKPDKGPWTPLYPYLEEVEELESPEQKVAESARKKVKPEQFEKGRAEISLRLDESRVASYEVMTVTEKVMASGDSPFSKDSSQGFSWGRIIHKLLEAVARDEGIDLSMLTENLLKEEGRLPSDKESIISMVKGIISSEIWQRMKRAEKVLLEVPFSTTEKDGGKLKIVSGTMDLVFKEKDGWVIADYKTDKVDGNLEALVAFHKPQVEMYREFYEQISGEKVKEAGLYFTDAGKWVAV